MFGSKETTRGMVFCLNFLCWIIVFGLITFCLNSLLPKFCHLILSSSHFHTNESSSNVSFWQPPEIGLKLNIKASLNPMKQRCGVGLAIRDEDSIIVYAKTKFVSKYSSPVHCEAIALMESIQVVVNRGLKSHQLSRMQKLLFKRSIMFDHLLLRSSSLLRVFCSYFLP